MVCTYDFSGNCRAIRLCKPEIFEYRGFSPRITANSRDRELSLPQFALFVLFLPRLLRYTRWEQDIDLRGQDGLYAIQELIQTPPIQRLGGMPIDTFIN